jgi:hypothetical protein
VIPTQVFDFETREWVRYEESRYPIPQSEADPGGVDSVEKEDVEDEQQAPVEEAPPRSSAPPVLSETFSVLEYPEEVVEEAEDGDD